jgi:hypothetical protein
MVASTDMPTIDLTDAQVIALFRQLSPERKRAALVALAQQDRAERARWAEQAEEQLRRRAAERGHEWDTMTEEQRGRFIDDLLHER